MNTPRLFLNVCISSWQVYIFAHFYIINSLRPSMEECRQSFQCSGDRRLEIVSGRGFNNNQVSRARSPDLAGVTSRGTWPSQVAAAPSSNKPWGFNDPEMKRRKRIAKYKVYTIEGKVKTSIRNGLRWFKNKCSEIIHGY
ncbi:hypothetical protein CQW23_22340 [Capsicum baccatum]|uniref:DUF3511 domain-containing protein n=1 Tax=Capsicum baccatum TaxID=33114 RepID=A0A2G2W0K5_CAPBA|nr:hypothetical protein CQW23_22340 [Capsicum baccatum]